jgi:fatty acid-binding protein DegV
MIQIVMDSGVDLPAELLKKIGDRLANIVVVLAEAPEQAAALVEQVRSDFKVAALFVTSLSLSLAVHPGPGTVGLVAYPVE